MNDIKPRTVYLLGRADKEGDEKDTYIGSTSLTLKRRLQIHIHAAKRCNTKLYKRMVETGPENWVIEPLLTFSCDKKTIFDFEREYINVVNTNLKVLSPVRESNEKNRESARKHYLNSLKTKRYYCNVCNKAFGCGADLKKHLKSLKHSHAYMNSMD